MLKNKDYQTTNMNKIYKLLLSFGFFATLLFSSCELYNPAEPIPAYIHIENFGLTTDYLTEGSNSHKITDAWVYVDDQLIGCFELPATFPVIAEGTHKVKIVAGIKVNGIASNRGQYPFYNPYEQYVNFEIGKKITLSPTVTYKSTTTFAFMEDFEVSSLTLQTTINSDSTIQEVVFPDPNVFEGSKSMIGYTDPTRFRFECITADSFALPQAGAPVFLEFNYRCNYTIVVSIIARGTTTSGQFICLNLNPTYNNWKKAYIYLTPNVSGTFTAIDYKMVWGFHNIIPLDSAVLMLDNIKLVY